MALPQRHESAGKTLDSCLHKTWFLNSSLKCLKPVLGVLIYRSREYVHVSWAAHVGPQDIELVYKCVAISRSRRYGPVGIADFTAGDAEVTLCLTSLQSSNLPSFHGTLVAEGSS